ncbi:MAG: COX15/CtaA family protein [Proteobacteria bacterium]|nr:COX15/CtaA family protein [Pseudomonadota bacterium]
MACAALVFTIVVVGGLTRLTHSGLSIVEWQPLVGTVPPLTQADWEASFAGYRMTPEFKRVNFDIDLDGYKRIFWLEYFHRLLGRLTGLVFLLPLVWFIFRGAVRGALAWRLGGIFILGALQGAMGWYMVKSGLVDDPRVSQFRLTAHLGLAFIIFAAQLWTAFGLLAPSGAGASGAPRNRLAGFALSLCAVIFVMVLSGGMVAGIRAGFAYNTFPLMNGQFIPAEIMLIEPWYKNFFYNMATVQFVHRSIAWLLMLLVPMLWWQARSVPGVRRPAHVLLGALGVQVALGISTLLLHVPIPLAAAHQAGAALLFAAALRVAHAARRASHDR